MKYLFHLTDHWANYGKDFLHFGDKLICRPFMVAFEFKISISISTVGIVPSDNISGTKKAFAYERIIRYLISIKSDTAMHIIINHFAHFFRRLKRKGYIRAR